MADNRLCADKKFIELIRSKLNSEKDVLRFRSEGELMDVFMFAIALGVDKGIRTPSNLREGFVLESVLKRKPQYLNFIYSIAFQELLKDHREAELANDDLGTVLEIAEEFANTGFQMIEEQISDLRNYNEEDFVYQMVELLDHRFEERRQQDQ